MSRPVFCSRLRYALQRARFGGVTASRRKFWTAWLKPDQKKPDHICRKTASQMLVEISHSAGRIATAMDVTTRTFLFPYRSDARPQKISAGIWMTTSAVTHAVYCHQMG